MIDKQQKIMFTFTRGGNTWYLNNEFKITSIHKQRTNIFTWGTNIRVIGATFT